ncbi:hypothetical protein BDQ12DRAFT_250312 [Crucibulum laeve]|uniref:Uncharacterized protein n=1 Tax=Crucibulum laeve TaxID=68775 RepID=A0A5C3LX09_9AGAR|nr:hypothetical protein BDQ12DRAFT_250312 [Crucibulum laeve]
MPGLLNTLSTFSSPPKEAVPLSSLSNLSTDLVKLYYMTSLSVLIIGGSQHWTPCICSTVRLMYIRYVQSGIKTGACKSMRSREGDALVYEAVKRARTEATEEKDIDQTPIHQILPEGTSTLHPLKGFRCTLANPVT